MFASVLKILSAQLIELLLLLGGVKENPGPTKKLKCGNSKKRLGKSTENKPLFYCTICGWVHNQCSGLFDANEYNSNNFTCVKCKRERVVSTALSNNKELQTVHKFFTEVNHPSSYGSISRLIKETGPNRQTVENYLTHNSTYTKFNMQSLANENRNTRYLLVAVDTLSCFLRVQPMKDQYASKTRRACVTTISTKPEKVWTDDDKECLGSFKKQSEQKI